MTTLVGLHFPPIRALIEEMGSYCRYCASQDSSLTSSIILHKHKFSKMSWKQQEVGYLRLEVTLKCWFLWGFLHNHISMLTWWQFYWIKWDLHLLSILWCKLASQVTGFSQVCVTFLKISNRGWCCFESVTKAIPSNTMWCCTEPPPPQCSFYRGASCSLKSHVTALIISSLLQPSPSPLVPIIPSAPHNAGGCCYWFERVAAPHLDTDDAECGVVKPRKAITW